MNLTPGRVSQLAGKAVKEGWLRKDGRHYAIKRPSPFSPGWSKSPADSEQTKTE